MRGRRYDDHRLSRMTIGYCQIFTAKFGAFSPEYLRFGKIR
jgi:hypothetical protein